METDDLHGNWNFISLVFFVLSSCSDPYHIPLQEENTYLNED